MSDRPAEPNTDEIEITEAMLDAGERVLMSFHTMFANERTWAEKVYRAMQGTRLGRASVFHGADKS